MTEVHIVVTGDADTPHTAFIVPPDKTRTDAEALAYWRAHEKPIVIKHLRAAAEAATKRADDMEGPA